MLDAAFVRDHPDQLRAALSHRGIDADADLAALAELDARRRQLIPEVETLKRRQNAAGEEVARAKRQGQDVSALHDASRERGRQIKVLEAELDTLEQQRRALLLRVPNVPDASVPVGRSAADNVEIRRHGEPRRFDFTPKPHWELAAALGIVDFERGPKLAGSGFPLFVGDGAKLVRVLIDFMLDLHVEKHGYLEMHPAIAINSRALRGTGQLPKMADDMYKIEGEDLWLNPTAEVPVTNIYADEILDAGVVPRYLTAYCPSFRKESGAYGKDTRGIQRLHQFDKVELVKFVPPETSYDEHEKLRADVEDVFKALELPFRVLLLCAGDMSFAAAKCYDFETWAPGQQAWLEVSSCSNFEAFQARRAGIRFRREAGAKPEFVHTLNASGLALPRTVITILEQNQEADGRVRIPQALVPLMGKEWLAPAR